MHFDVFFDAKSLAGKLWAPDLIPQSDLGCDSKKVA